MTWIDDLSLIRFRFRRYVVSFQWKTPDSDWQHEEFKAWTKRSAARRVNKIIGRRVVDRQMRFPVPEQYR